ncbi:response regulator [Agrococcus carbonis]|uniref:DNA-binding response regulator, NarL/FixJ family, contains REC and HTH domains n=1 Tax=Agrococcus carbonis TaxID=684552 RepID=A0A1H1L2K4_9MICO|nr:response regulator transcription factor [Agrococcus carbonis]SDR68512.1 DNA-binding response regulator, NarL/FixJ family, contains REC and HTH domains [Agrococcus carbonis]
MIRVLIVDDQALFRGGIRMLVASQPDMVCVGEAADGAQAVRVAAEQEPDVVLMDVRMPVLDGISATARIVQARPATRVVVLTTFDLDEAAARAIRAGASGFVLKDAEPELVLASIRTVHAGNEVVAASATRELFKAFGAQRRTVPQAFAELTDRERQIFALAAKGLSNTEIARGEFVSEATVKTHISRILQKLGLRDRVQLVVFAYEHGLAGEHV